MGTTTTDFETLTDFQKLTKSQQQLVRDRELYRSRLEFKNSMNRCSEQLSHNNAPTTEFQKLKSLMKQRKQLLKESMATTARPFPGTSETIQRIREFQLARDRGWETTFISKQQKPQEEEEEEEEEEENMATTTTETTL